MRWIDPHPIRDNPFSQQHQRVRTVRRAALKLLPTAIFSHVPGKRFLPLVHPATAHFADDSGVSAIRSRNFPRFSFP